MQPYKNLSGTSGVVEFESAADHIDIGFKGGAIYRYDDKVPGSQQVETMKLLAENGRGLATFINQNVRKKFAAKLR
jgi:hypothetical protein